MVLNELPTFSSLNAPPSTVLSAQLVTPEPPPPARDQVKTAAPKPAVRTPQRSIPQPLPAPVAEGMPLPSSSPQETASADEEPNEPQAEPPQPLSAQAQEVPSPPEPVAAAPTPATEPVRDLPASGTISYEVFLGSRRFHIGRTVQTWEIGERTYRLSSVSETTGLAGFFRPNQLSYFSEGVIDASGFRPERFTVRRGRNGARHYSVYFDWTAKELTLGPVAAPRKVALPEGALDVLSFIFQLARSALAPGRFDLNITTGNKLEVHTIEVGNEENLDVPLGTMRTVPVRQVRRPGQEGIEVWLAPERQYLPVRIRFVDRNGATSGEQLAADIAAEPR